MLAVCNDIDEGETVPDHVQMLVEPEVGADSPGTAASGHSTRGNSYSIVCGTCGRTTSRQDVKLLRDAIECLATANVKAKGRYRISIT